MGLGVAQPIRKAGSGGCQNASTTEYVSGWTDDASNGLNWQLNSPKL
jgi:hypothetical protein